MVLIVPAGRVTHDPRMEKLVRGNLFGCCCCFGFALHLKRLLCKILELLHFYTSFLERHGVGRRRNGRELRGLFFGELLRVDNHAVIIADVDPAKESTRSNSAATSAEASLARFPPKDICGNTTMLITTRHQLYHPRSL